MNKTLVKICGITNEADAFAAAQAGASYLGYILLYPASPRCITVVQAKTIIGRVRQVYPQVKHVGVFVDRSVAEVQVVTNSALLDVAQLHGKESNEYIQQLSVPTVWKTIEVNSSTDLLRLHDPSAYSAIHLDSGKGSGKTIPTELLDQVDFSQPIVLAGGVTPENIQALVTRYRPSVIDVNSGVEVVPGKKDPNKLKQLFQAVNTSLLNPPTHMSKTWG